jgi:putative transposase
MINKLSVQFSIVEICDCLDVSRSGYYAYRHRNKYPGKRAITNRKLSVKINALYLEHKRRYGSPKITQCLRKNRESINHKRVERLMRTEGLYARRKKRFKPVTTNSKHENPIAPNLLPQYKERLSRINQVWVSDITYIPTREGFLYLSVIMDLFSRKLIGWRCDDHLKSSLIIDAFKMALTRRRPPAEMLLHSDRGIQYASNESRAFFQKYNVQSSMSRKGNCYDNAAMESFFSLLKTEALPEGGVFINKDIAKTELFEYIECYYNRKRIHSSIGYDSPVDFEQSLNKAVRF